MRTPKIGSRWQHYKGGLYVISDIGIDASRHEDGKAVWYYREDEPDQKFYRPLLEWHNPIEYEGEVVPRFRELEKGGTTLGAIDGIFAKGIKGNRRTYRRPRV
ncbi:DUF1653 domain-containing protein (plasmid) [Paenibacillus urinalis]|uniref:DUF1653 domain-containing protein n=1 Tax=Paenibacillus urinalis TaxID=521520 RepID=A0ABY7XKU2_9BACL|nr:DUF1653 domain-containing protein [Paenibacillus urinalis]WDI05157.1 DUF1653 domain-containing protein [Paenibacillus urinalis]